MNTEDALGTVLRGNVEALVRALLELTPRAARHEAAHAVAAHLVGGRVIAVAIIPRRDESGWVDGDCHWRPGPTTTLRDRAVVALAGAVASNGGGHGDERFARTVADELVEQWREEARELVEQHRPMIERLAAALLERRELAEDEVRAILSASDEEPPVVDASRVDAVEAPG
ncbi:MAG: hypothetical protein AB1689_12460 [Thermodesulfobacteriota bacterium]